MAAKCECRVFGEGYDCEISIRRHGKEFRSHAEARTAPWKGEDPPLTYLRKLTRWQDGFLFVPSACGTGNAWRCRTDFVFAVRNGDLICIGNLAPYKESEGHWLTYENGLFYDVYDGLELNELVSHAESPLFGMVMTEQSGRFVADLDRTWELNKNYYDRCLADINQYLEGGGGASEPYRGVVSSLLHNAALARYCDREKELDKSLSQAKCMLSAQDFDVFRGLAYSVVPGATHSSLPPE